MGGWVFVMVFVFRKLTRVVGIAHGQRKGICVFWGQQRGQIDAPHVLSIQPRP